MTTKELTEKEEEKVILLLHALLMAMNNKEKVTSIKGLYRVASHYVKRFSIKGSDFLLIKDMTIEEICKLYISKINKK